MGDLNIKPDAFVYEAAIKAWKNSTDSQLYRRPFCDTSNTYKPLETQQQQRQRETASETVKTTILAESQCSLSSTYIHPRRSWLEVYYSTK
jgi:hypothetical protein